MVEQRACLRIREGSFTYLLVTDPTVSIEARNPETFEPVADKQALITAWARSGGDRVPVVRLGTLLETPVPEWQYAMLLSDGTHRIGVAAEHIDLIPEPDIPAIQPFNPPGARVPGGSVITGLCPQTDPEYLVLDPPRLQRCLHRVAAPAEGRT